MVPVKEGTHSIPALFLVTFVSLALLPSVTTIHCLAKYLDNTQKVAQATELLDNRKMLRIMKTKRKKNESAWIKKGTLEQEQNSVIYEAMKRK